MKVLAKDKFKKEFEKQYKYHKEMIDITNNTNKRLKQIPLNEGLIRFEDDPRLIWDKEEETYSLDSVSIMFMVYEAFKNNSEYKVKPFEYYILSLEELEEIWDRYEENSGVCVKMF